MKKIVLDVETLTVDSFDAESNTLGTRGTVRGYVTALRCNNTDFYCTLGYNTCAQASCVDTCGYPYKPAC